MKTIVWFREDLRLFDNPALHYAVSCGSILPVFIYPEGLGGASYWWLHHSLKSLSEKLAEYGIPLVLRTGEPESVLKTLSADVCAEQVVWNRVYSPTGIRQGLRVKDALSTLKTQSFNGQLLIEPTKVLNKQGTPFKVFTPFWRHCMANMVTPNLCDEPKKITGFAQSVRSQSLDSWSLLPTQPDWSLGFYEHWMPGEDGAQKRWRYFLESVVYKYKDGRDFPSERNTSYLSPHLAFGEISPRQIWCDTQQAMVSTDVDESNAQKFLSEIGWREFSRYLLVHFPTILTEPFNPRFKHFSWQDDKALLTAWQKGLTGYPIVDAGMRELWQTGYMHNRVRMIVGSFLTKHCLTHWREGVAWFSDTLLDADIANNTASWQWVSGCGADAAPYFRIFNPILQSEKFDKDGTYIKRWVPELSELPKKIIHKPWEADRQILSNAGVTLGQDYPFPIVDHQQARQLALDSYQHIKSVNAG